PHPIRAFSQALGRARAGCAPEASGPTAAPPGSRDNYGACRGRSGRRPGDRRANLFRSQTPRSISAEQTQFTLPPRRFLSVGSAASRVPQAFSSAACSATLCSLLRRNQALRQPRANSRLAGNLVRELVSLVLQNRIHASISV